jgi:hypothetical protein
VEISQRCCNLSLYRYWKLLNVQTRAADYWQEILSDHLLFVVDHHGQLLVFYSVLTQRCLLFDVVLPTEKGRGWLLPFYSLWSLNRPCSASHELPGRWRCFASDWPCSICPYPQDVVILLFSLLIKFKRSLRVQRAPRRSDLGKPSVAILFSPIPQKLNLFSCSIEKLLDFWPMLSKQHCAAVTYFSTEQQELPSHDCCKVWKYVERWEEDIVLRKKARCHANSETLKKNDEDVKVSKHPRWPGFSKPWRFS